MIPLIDRPGIAFGKLQRLRVNCHKEIYRAARNHLARAAVA